MFRLNVRFNTSESMFPSFNLCMFTEKDDSTINNEDRKKIK